MNIPTTEGADDESKMITSEHASEVKGVIGESQAERGTRLRAELAEAEKDSERFNKRAKELVDQVSEMENAHDAELITLTRLQMSGKISEETLAAEQASKRNDEEFLKREMNRHFEMAKEADEKALLLRAELGEKN